MSDPGLTAGGFLSHRARFGGVVGAACRRRSCARDPKWVRSGPSWPPATPRIAWQPTHAWLVKTWRPRAAGLPSAGSAAGAFCRATQAWKSAGRLHHRAEPHVGVGDAAELGALARVLAGPVRGQQEPVRLAGDGVPLAPEGRRPEAVDHVRRHQLDDHALARRQVEVGRGRRRRGRGRRTPTTTGDRSRAPAAHRRRAAPGCGRSPPTVGNAMNVRMIAGATVHPSSSFALPRTWRGRASGSRSRKRTIAQQERDRHHQEDRDVPPEDLQEDRVAEPGEVGDGLERGLRGGEPAPGQRGDERDQTRRARRRQETARSRGSGPSGTARMLPSFETHPPPPTPSPPTGGRGLRTLRACGARTRSERTPSGSENLDGRRAPRYEG